MSHNSDNEKPILLLPTRILIVPCDYVPPGERPVQWIEQTVSIKYDMDIHGRIRGAGSIYAARKIVRQDPPTICGDPVRFV